MLCASFLLGLGHILGLEGVKYLKDLASLAESRDKIFGIFARTVHLCLISAIKLDAKGSDTAQKFVLKVLCIVFMTAPGVGNVNVGATDILVVSIADNRLNVSGDLTATVKLVPRNKEAGLLTLFLKSLNHEKAGCYISKVTDMNRTRGADTCCAYVLLFIGIFLYNSLG